MLYYYTVYICGTFIYQNLSNQNNFKHDNFNCFQLFYILKRIKTINYYGNFFTNFNYDI